MYIEPNTSIIILKNCPLDTTYEHTIYFESKSAQTEYFKGLKKYTLERNTYQRVKRGYMRINIQAENLYDCNYLMFQNTSFGSKWFYAFIKSVEYINNVVSEIEFEIDVMQTWFFDYKLQECFVEREHSATDVAGENTVPEKLELGDYISFTSQKAGVSNYLCYIVDATIAENYGDYLGGTTGEFIDGKKLFSGMSKIAFKNPDDLLSWLNVWSYNSDTGKQKEYLVKVKEGVKNIRIGVADGDTNSTTTMFAKREVVHFNTNTESVGSYTPRNKKLLTYPYYFLYVTNLAGNSAIYPFEYFLDRNNPSFYLSVDSSDNSPCLLIPLNYKGLGENKDETLSLNSFPSLSWGSDTYAEWAVRTKTNMLPNIVNALSTGIVQGSFTGSVGAGVAMSGVNLILNTMAQHKMADLQPPQANGRTSGNTLYWNDMIDFNLISKGIKPEYCVIIDEFFDKYGYATHRLKKPNRSVRPYWCYTKTIDCTIKGSVPCDDMKKICSVYDKGVTFWKNGDNIGNYSLDNTV